MKGKENVREKGRRGKKNEEREKGRKKKRYWEVKG
jgi:hypothetical protein